MKALRSPIVTGFLVVVAVGVVVYQIMGSRRPVFRRSSATAPAPVAKQAAPAPLPAPFAAATPQAAKSGPSVHAPPPRTDVPPGTPINCDYVQSHFGLWTEAPQRDPFQLLLPAAHVTGGPTNGPSPVSNWKLKGIWRQTAGRVAAINDGTYREGEMIEGYRIQRIDADLVWLEGTNQIEHLGFSKDEPSGKKPAPGRKK